jgi:hypothetical protein
LGGLGVACLAFAAIPSPLGPLPRAWALTAGFLLLFAAVGVSSRRAFAPLVLAAAFTVYGGLSAVLAVPGSEVGAVLSERYDVAVTNEVFVHASMITALGGAAAIGGALLAAVGAVGSRRAEPPAERLERAGRALVLAGFAGVALALVRFSVTQLPVDDLWPAAKSFWIGGSYFLLLAIFAVPGFGLWLQGLLARGAGWRDLTRFGAALALYLTVLVPTGQRVFATALALILLAVLASRGRVSRRALASLAILGVVVLGLTQAVRNQAAETGEVGLGDYLARVAPDQWDTLYGNQLTSFRWTAVVHANGDRLDIPNPFVQTLLKPIPRQLYREKSQGFGSEFTSRVFPEVYANQVSYATPLTAEAEYSFGPVGVLAVFLALGVLAGRAERRFVRGAPKLVEPIVMATIAWCVLVFVRGDLANALVFSAGWVTPLVLVSSRIGLRGEAGVERTRTGAEPASTTAPASSAC